jgi:acyl-coenzyme A thioesterase PaaI-like protein
MAVCHTAVCRVEVEDVHLNGNGTLHGVVYASPIDNATGLSVAALVGLRTATIALDVHFLGAVREGPIRPVARCSHARSAFGLYHSGLVSREGGGPPATAKEDACSARRGRG